MNTLKISTRLTLLIGLLSLLTLGVGLMGLWGQGRANDGLKTVYEDRVLPLEQMADIQRLQLGNQMSIRHALLDATPEQSDRSVAAIDERLAQIDTQWKAYTATRLTAEEEKLVKAFVESRDRFMADALRPALAALRSRDFARLKTLEAEALRPLQAGMDHNTEALIALQVTVARQAYEEAVAHYERLRAASLVVIALGVLIGAAFGVSLVRSLSRQLGTEPATAAALADSVAGGNLAVAITLAPGDSSSLMASLAAMRNSLRQVVANVRHHADSLATASQQIAQGNLDLSSRTEEQASALQQTAASMEQLAATVRQNAGNAVQASELARGASHVAHQGGEVVARAVGTMREINESSKRIADITGVIDGIAFQTNILALNAAVEAARAGEEGRGFAVVASEVRSLAQRSADAARQIKTLITDSVQRVEHGTRLVDDAGASMNEIVQAIRRVTDIMGEISAASTEQSAGVTQIGEAVSQLDQATQQNAALVEESAAAAESLKTQARQLVQTVAVFTLGGERAAAITPAAPSTHAAPAPRVPAARPAAPAAPVASTTAPTAAPASRSTDPHWESF